MDMGSLFNLPGSLFNMIGGMINNQKNFKLQKEAQEWNKFAQQETWRRQDTALQRARADAEAAGFSPFSVAGGSGAATSSPIQLTAPQKQFSPAPNVGDIAGNVINLISQKKAIDQTEAQTNYLNKQAENVSADTLLKGLEAGIKPQQLVNLQEQMKTEQARQEQIKAGTADQKQKTAYDKYDAERNISGGYKSTGPESTPGKMLYDAREAAGGVMREVKQGFNSLSNFVGGQLKRIQNRTPANPVNSYKEQTTNKGIGGYMINGY